MIHVNVLALAGAPWWRPLGYTLVFAGMIAEGDSVLLTAAFLTHAGYFTLRTMVLAALSGVLIGDLLWYSLGARLATSTSLAGRWINRLASPLDAQVRRRPFHTIFLSKFAYGIGHALLARIGALRVPRWRFLASDIPATLLWASIVGGLGYFSSLSFVVFRAYLRRAELALLGGLMMLWTIGHFIARQSRKTLAAPPSEGQ